MKKLVFVITGLTILVILVGSLWPKTTQASYYGYTYLPYLAANWPPKCENNPFRTETHDISNEMPGYSYWGTGSYSGTEVVLLLWFKMPGFDSTLYRMRVTPEMGSIYILGGGTAKYWGPGCAAEADAAYAWDDKLPEIDMAWLEKHNLLIDPAVCNAEPTEEVRDPVKDVPWLLGGPREIVVLNPGWSNQKPDDQGESKTLLFPEGDWEWPILMGGRAYTFPAGCGKQAEAFYNASELPACNLQCLADRGLMAWPTP